MSPLARVTLIALLWVPGTAAAQGNSVSASTATIDVDEPTATGGDALPDRRPLRSACGHVERLDDGTLLGEDLRLNRRANDEPGHRLGTDFRGFGSPGRDHSFTTSFAFAARGDRASGAGGLGLSIAGDFVIYNLGDAGVGRICLTAGFDTLLFGGVVGRPFDQMTGGRVAPRVGALFRTRDDSVRLQLEGQAVLDPVGLADVDGTPLAQAGYAGAIALSITDEILTLSPMVWGARGIGRLTYRWGAPANPGAGFWIDLRVALGYASLRSPFGPRGGMVGGVDLLLLGGGELVPDGSAPSLRGGARAAISFGSLWPSDVVLPMEVGGLVELAWSEGCVRSTDEHFVTPAAWHRFGLEGSAVFARNIAFAAMDTFGWENYARIVLSYSVGFAAATATNGEGC